MVLVQLLSINIKFCESSFAQFSLKIRECPELGTSQFLSQIRPLRNIFVIEEETVLEIS